MRLSFKFVLPVVFLVLVSLDVLVPATRGHVEEAGEKWILAKHVQGQIRLETQESSPQWAASFEAEIERDNQGHVEVFAVNNGTHVYLLLIWEDETENQTDGAAVFFEVQDEETNAWYWSPTPVVDISNAGVVANASWNEGKWSLVIGRSLYQQASLVELKVGEPMRDFVKIGVWDGARGQSFENINAEELEHVNFLALPQIETQPKDPFLWGGIILIAAVGFVLIEAKRYKLVVR